MFEFFNIFKKKYGLNISGAMCIPPIKKKNPKKTKGYEIFVLRKA
ncbi:MAG: hypothetical protein CM15mP26_1930 [Actinomycetota bacterium]|nr:MAG: hypothetical protein CM15mP26_1930 [Actinomycetota bacterium]